MASSVSVAFDSSASLDGTALVSGSTAVLFGLAASLDGAGQIDGASATSFGGSGELAASGRMSGSSNILFGEDALLAGDGVLDGECLLAFGSAADLAGDGELSGAAAATFRSEADLTGSGGGVILGPLSGSIFLAFGSDATLSSSFSAPPLPAEKPLTGWDRLTFRNFRRKRKKPAPVASPRIVFISGRASMAFSLSGALELHLGLDRSVQAPHFRAPEPLPASAPPSAQSPRGRTFKIDRPASARIARIRGTCGLKFECRGNLHSDESEMEALLVAMMAMEEET